MTPKEQYEARKAQRNARRALMERADEDAMILDTMDTLDRMATALERIADNLEAREPHLATIWKPA